MSMRSLLVSSLALAALSLSAAAQTHICSESFDYPTGSSLHGQAGGSGWVNSWWSDFSGASGIDIVGPGMDGIGMMGHVAVENEGGYRKPDTSIVPELDEGGLMGKDGGILWLSYMAIRPGGVQDQFGGISLYEQFVGEKLFVGSPWMSGAWGIGVPGVGDFPIAGTTCNAQTHIVARIDFLPGDERVRLYLDPGVPFPTSGEQLDMTVPDFRFNEIGVRSGGTTAVGGTYIGGFQFDAINLHGGEVAGGIGTTFCEGVGGACPCGNDNDGSLGAAGCANGSSAGGCAVRGTGSTSVGADDLVLEAEGMVPSQPGLFFQGQNAINGGAGNTFGDGLRCAGGGVIRLQVLFAASDGTAATSIGIATRGGCVAGDVKRYQLWSRDPSGSPCGAQFNLSNGLEINWTA